MDLLPDTEALQRFATIWEHVECGIAIIDAETREIVAVNPVAARMFGDDVEKIIGKRCHKFICPAEENSCPIMDKGMVVDRSERKFVKADGETIPIIKSVAKIQYNGRLALLESFADISHLKEAEKKLMHLSVTEEANRAKSDFLSRMSHEMRTPMNAIIGMTRIAENTDDIAKLKYCLSMIGASSEHLLGLINDVLDMAKIEAGKLELDCVPLDIEEVLSRICNLLIEKIEQKRIRLSVVMGRGMATRYRGDDMRLAQVITNLLANAVKFTPKGGKITLTVDEATKTAQASVLRFTITDTGIGMTREQTGKLFSAFEQADTTITRRFGGTGLGLMICKSIVEKMGGSIDVTSTPGKGSAFTVAVELERPEQGEVAQLDDATLSGLRVLVADSDLDAIEQFKNITGHSTLRIDEAHSGDEALARIAAARKAGEPYDILFVGYNLPDMNAVTLAKQLGPDVDMNAFVMMTSFLQWNKIDEEACGTGIQRFVAKPLFPTAIIKAIRRVADTACSFNEEAPEARGEAPDFSHVSLLLAEDVAINTEIFLALLENTRIQIDVAENGKVAVDMFRNNPDKYDAIIMDVQMPVMDGHEATRTIRALPLPRARTIPIIAMTANVFKADIEQCLASGMDDHLAKPIDEQKVIEKIREYCGG